MMLSHDAWLKVITEIVGEIASPEQQQAKWFGKGPLYSSPDEVYNQLFDDYAFDLFYDSYSGGFTAAQESAWKELKNSLKKYSDRIPDDGNPLPVFNDPDWHAVGAIAHKWLRTFDQRQ